MRRNKIGDIYCTTADELMAVLDGFPCDNVYVENIDLPEGENQANVEVVHNCDGDSDGDTVCFVEAPTIKMVEEILMQAGLELYPL